MSYKTIREVTSITGATESALRYYDEKALVCPTVKKSDGRREWLYDAAAISDISKIIGSLLLISVGVLGLLFLLLEHPFINKTSITISTKATITINHFLKK